VSVTQPRIEGSLSAGIHPVILSSSPDTLGYCQPPLMPRNPLLQQRGQKDHFSTSISSDCFDLFRPGEVYFIVRSNAVTQSEASSQTLSIKEVDYIKSMFTIENLKEVISFLTENRDLLQLLSVLKQELSRRFIDCSLVMRLFSFEEDGELMKWLTVHVQVDPKDTKTIELLNRFNEEWLSDHIDQVYGRVIVSLEAR